MTAEIQNKVMGSHKQIVAATVATWIARGCVLAILGVAFGISSVSQAVKKIIKKYQ